VWGTMNKGNEELEHIIIIWDRKLGSWDGSIVRKTEESVNQRKKLRNTVREFVCSEKEDNVIQRNFLRNTVPILCAVKKWLWNAGRWARRWTVKLVRDSGGVLNGAPQFAGRPEGEVQWHADVYRVRQSRTSDFQPARCCGWSRGDLLLARQSAALLPSCARPICHATLAFLNFSFVSSKNLTQHKLS
jgi:hypothetical protein